MDLQPARNVGLENQLQAIQLGASLYDRAQTQKRMMEQLQMQTAESLLQRQGMELQNKIRDMTLADAIGEQKAQVEEFDTFSKLGREVSDYLNNPKPDSKFPVVPPFKSKTYRLEADKMLNNLEKYSARAELFRARAKADAEADRIAASTLNEAIKFGAITKNPDGSLGINVDLLNQRAFDFKKTEQERTKAQTGAIGSNIQLAKDKLNALIANNASDAEIAKAKLAVDKSYKEARIQLDQEELAEKKLSGQEQRKLNREKFDFEKGVQLKKLDLQELDLGQRVKRTDAYIQNLLKPVAQKDVKLNTFDDGVVRKTASFVANQQSAADSIERTIEILDDPNVDQSVKIRSAQLLAKDLNDPKGRDAVGNQEADRILGELDIISFSRAWDKGDISAFLGRDLSGFREKLELTKNGLDSKISKSVDRINSIYKKYEGGAAGTPQTPSRSAMITAPATQAMSSTNSPAMSGTNSLSEISFESTAEARAKGKKTGDFVIIRGVKGNLK